MNKTTINSIFDNIKQKKKADNFEDLLNYNHKKYQEKIFVVYDLIWANKVEHFFTTISAIVILIFNKIIIGLEMRINGLWKMSILSFNDK